MSSTAPTNAVMMAPISPPAWMPRRPKSHPPRSAPMMPTIMSPIMPKPPPRMTRPASQPAIRPIRRNQIRLVRLMRLRYHSDPRLCAGHLVLEGVHGADGVLRALAGRRSLRGAGELAVRAGGAGAPGAEQAAADERRRLLE